MPRRNIRVVVELNIHAVTAPGVWLSSREDVYLGVSMFGQYRRTKLTRAMFPLFIHEKLKFEKTYYTALCPSDIVNLLEDEPVLFELVQLSQFSVGGVRLASFATDTQDFLYPYPSLAPSYAPTEREILLNRTVNFPGISPKVEFSSKATIRESVHSEFDALEDAIEEQKAALKALRREVQSSNSLSPRRSRSRRRSNGYDKPTLSSVVRSRSPSPSFIRRFEDCCLDEDNDIKPPFVVKKLDDSLIGRKPGSPAAKAFLGSGSKSRRRSRSLPRRQSSCSIESDTDGGVCGVCHRPYRESSCRVCRTYRKHTGQRYWGHTPPYNRLAHCSHSSTTQVVRDPYSSLSRPVYSSRLVTDESEDEEVAELLARPPSYSSLPRPRSVSPVMYRRSFRDRYSDSAFSPRLSERIADRVDSALRRSNSLVKLSREIARSSSPSPRYYDSYYNGYDSLDELETDFSVAKNRSLVHLDEGQYWTEKAAEYRGLSHEQLFQENLRKLYSKLGWQTVSSEAR